MPDDRAPAPDQPTQAERGLEAYIQRNAPQVVAVTYWFDPPPEPPIQQVTLRVSGRRLGVIGLPRSKDSFTRDECYGGVVPGSGPVAMTVKVRDVNPGDWSVNARVINTDKDRDGRGPRARQSVPEAHRTRWSWLRWRVLTAQPTPVGTRSAAFVRPPAVILGSWPALVVAGIVLALGIQSAVFNAVDVQLRHVLLVSLLSVLAGIIGAKLWYIVIHRKGRRRDGWCVQGFVAAIVVVTPVTLVVFAVPVGPFLDATAPGLMVGLAVGRLGCFFTGCCAGRPTASRLGVWSSNRRVGIRRVPTQLLESALALAIGLGVLVAVLVSGPAHGELLIAAIASYTLVRQGLLLLREERRQSRHGFAIIAAIAVAVLVADLVLLLMA